MSTPTPPPPSAGRGVPRARLRAATRRVPRTARAGGGGESGANEESAVETEPNMKLSRALFVMLLLHIVAVGGVFAFSLIKERGPRSGHRSNGDSARTSAAAANPNNKPAETDELSRARSGMNSDSTRNRPGAYIVRPGETLDHIANEHGVSLEALVAANGGAPFATSRPRPGQEIKLPEKPASTPPPLPTAASASPPAKAATPPNRPQTDAQRFIEDSGGGAASTEKSYVVGKSETVYSIAKKLKINYDALLRLNHIEDPKKIRAGQKLRLPSKPKP